MKKKYFLGWTNLKWIIKEIIKLYSDEKSFFSKKRVESGIAVIVGQWGMIYFLLININKLTASDIALWASVEFAVSGYLIHKIEQSKKLDSTLTTAGEEEKDK
jgi:hypothetical protein